MTNLGRHPCVATRHGFLQLHDRRQARLRPRNFKRLGIDTRSLLIVTLEVYLLRHVEAPARMRLSEMKTRE